MLILRWKPGALAMPTGEVLIAATATHTHTYRDLFAAALAAVRLRSGWRRRNGTVGLWLGGWPLQRRTVSISVWEDERHLREFLTSADHIAIVRRFKGRLDVRSATWTTERFDLALARQEAERRLTPAGLTRLAAAPRPGRPRRRRPGRGRSG